MNKNKITKIAVYLFPIFLIFSASLVLTYGYFYRVDLPNYIGRLELHNQIIEGNAGSPFNYRVLVPFIADKLYFLFSMISSNKTAFLLSYAVYDLLSIFFLLSMLFIWLKNWFKIDHALIGVLFVSTTMPIALQNHGYQPWSLLETGFFSAALILIYKNKIIPLFILVLFASLNRETAVFIAFLYLFANLNLKKPILNSETVLIFSGLFVISISVFISLRYFRGITPSVETIAGLFLRNITKENLYHTIINSFFIFGFFWIYIILGLRKTPVFIKRVSLVIPFYIITILIWGVWFEVRLLMPLYPIFLSIGLSYIYRE